jgi:RNA polymerase sigma-70 factor (ECF subfamily)
MRMRSKRRRKSRFESSDALDQRAEGEIDPASSLDLEHAIAKLPPQARAVIVLHDIEGYRHEEIAEFLSIAPGTSKAQLHRARHLLKEVLQ